jgi:hypothetical protein
MGQDRTRYVDVPHVVGGDHVVELLVVHLVSKSADGVALVDDGHVEPSQGVEDVGDHRGHRFAITHVDGEGHDAL